MDRVNNGFCLKALHSEDILPAQLASMQEKEKRRIVRTDKCICNFPIVSAYLIVRCEFVVGIYRVFGLHSDDVSIRPDAKIISYRSFCMGFGGISGRVKDHSFCMLVRYSVSKLPNSEPVTMWQSFGHTNWAGWVVKLSMWSRRGREAVALVPLEQRRKRRSNCVFFGIRALDCVNNGFCLKALRSEDILSAQLASMQEKEKRRIVRTDKCICNFPIVSAYLIVSCEFVVGIYRVFGLHSDDVSIRPDAKIISYRSFCMGFGGISGRVKDHSFCMLVRYSVCKLPNSEPVTMWQSFGHTNWAGWVVKLSMWSRRGREAVALVPLEQRRKRRSNCVFFGIRALDCVNNGFCLKALRSEDFLSAQLASMQEKEKRRIIRTDKCICNFTIVSAYLIVRCEFVVGIYRMFGLHSDDVSIRPDAKIISYRSFCMGFGGISGRVKDHSFCMLVRYSVSKLPNSEPVTMWQSFGHTNWAGWVVKLSMWSRRGREAVALVPLEQRRKRRSIFFKNQSFEFFQQLNFVLRRCSFCTICIDAGEREEAHRLAGWDWCMLMRLKRNALPKSACENEKLIIEFANQAFFLGQCNFGLDSDEHMDVKEEKRELSFLSKKERQGPYHIQFIFAWVKFGYRQIRMVYYNQKSQWPKSSNIS